MPLREDWANGEVVDAAAMNTIGARVNDLAPFINVAAEYGTTHTAIQAAVTAAPSGATLISTPPEKPPAGHSRPEVPFTYELQSLEHKEMPEQKWAVEGILPEGLTLLAGKPKLGKSMLSLCIAAAIGEGGIALG